MGGCALEEIDAGSLSRHREHWWYQVPQFTTACCVSYVYKLLPMHVPSMCHFPAFENHLTSLGRTVFGTIALMQQQFCIFSGAPSQRSSPRAIRTVSSRPGFGLDPPRRSKLNENPRRCFWKKANLQSRCDRCVLQWSTTLIGLRSSNGKNLQPNQILT